MRLIILLVTLWAGAEVSVAQTTRIDSLRRQLYQGRPGAQAQLSLLLSICSQYGSLPADSLSGYITTAQRLAALPDNRNLFPQVQYFNILNLSKKGMTDSALALAKACVLDKAFRRIPPLHWKIRLAITGLMVRQNRLREALENVLSLLEDAEQNKWAEEQVKALIQAGWIYMELNAYPEALNWFRKALAVNEKLRKLPEPAVLNSNIAAVFNSLGRNDSASLYVNRAIAQATTEQELTFLCNAYHIYADICIDSGNIRKAEEQLKKGLDIRRKIGDPFYVVSDLAQLGKFYASNGQQEKGVAVIREGIAIANAHKLYSKLIFLYSTLAQNYRTSGNFQACSQTLDTIIQLKDTLYSLNSAEALSGLQAQYELKQKENTIMRQRLDLVQKTYWMYGALGLLLFGALLGFIYYRNSRRKQQQQLQLARMEEKRQADKAVLLAREEERKRIAADLHDNLGAYAAAIAANADRISNGGGTDVVEELKKNAQSIVSQLNDSIWVLNKESLSLTAISDRLKVFMQRLQNSYPGVSLDVEEQLLTDRQLPPLQALHLFKILQEGIINALRHSGGDRVVVRISSNTGWQVSITDNGRGMPGDENGKAGNGLNNIRNRSREAGWIASWQHPPEGGTRLIIRPTTN